MEAGYSLTSGAYLIAKTPLADLENDPLVPYITENGGGGVRKKSEMPGPRLSTHHTMTILFWCFLLVMPRYCYCYRYFQPLSQAFQETLDEAALSTAADADVVRNTTLYVYLILLGVMLVFSELAFHHCSSSLRTLSRLGAVLYSFLHSNANPIPRGAKPLPRTQGIPDCAACCCECFGCLLYALPSFTSHYLLGILLSSWREQISKLKNSAESKVRRIARTEGDDDIGWEEESNQSDHSDAEDDVRRTLFSILRPASQ